MPDWWEDAVHTNYWQEMTETTQGETPFFLHPIFWKCSWSCFQSSCRGVCRIIAFLSLFSWSDSSFTSKWNPVCVKQPSQQLNCCVSIYNWSWGPETPRQQRGARWKRSKKCVVGQKRSVIWGGKEKLFFEDIRNMKRGKDKQPHTQHTQVMQTL